MGGEWTAHRLKWHHAVVSSYMPRWPCTAEQRTCSLPAGTKHLFRRVWISLCRAPLNLGLAMWAAAYHCASLYITVYHCISLYITVYHCISLYITVYHCISQYITVYHCISLYTTAYHCISLIQHCHLWRHLNCGLYEIRQKSCDPICEHM